MKHFYFTESTIRNKTNQNKTNTKKKTRKKRETKQKTQKKTSTTAPQPGAPTNHHRQYTKRKKQRPECIRQGAKRLGSPMNSAWLYTEKGETQQHNHRGTATTRLLLIELYQEYTIIMRAATQQ